MKPAWEKEKYATKFRDALLKRYPDRVPMAQLPDEFRVNETNPKPPLVYFGIPLNQFSESIIDFAERNQLAEYFSRGFDSEEPECLTWDAIENVVEQLSSEVGHKLSYEQPFAPTCESDIIVTLFSNFTPDEEKPTEEEEIQIIKKLKGTLGLGELVKAEWYFPYVDCSEATNDEEVEDDSEDDSEDEDEDGDGDEGQG